jgi:hypothetical protein
MSANETDIRNNGSSVDWFEVDAKNAARASERPETSKGQSRNCDDPAIVAEIAL